MLAIFLLTSSALLALSAFDLHATERSAVRPRRARALPLATVAAPVLHRGSALDCPAIYEDFDPEIDTLQVEVEADPGWDIGAANPVRLTARLSPDGRATIVGLLGNGATGDIALVARLDGVRPEDLDLAAMQVRLLPAI
ncbi:hypothetical protein V8J36_12765 [Frigidibacter sp. MR17.14]|uniref:hypothetical protein n=1 Tax=Frigidibacter sp. MR17.14 TaxID=3126509 RepID=UPI003012ECE1